MTSDECNYGTLISAIKFAAQKHRQQKRKDEAGTPYIIHPIEVVDLLYNEGGVRDTGVLIAAVLHDTVEDTGTKPEEIKEVFGEDVMKLVMECTDDKSLPKAERKRLQVENASHKSPRAKLIKLADKISNIQDLVKAPPKDWPLERKLEYLEWSSKVVAGLRGENPRLEEIYDRALEAAKKGLLSGAQS
jgi:GTP diphosphokinase / guanosine-3',5'-bis(diphosphate) 3'-diphosphatase